MQERERDNRVWRAVSSIPGQGAFVANVYVWGMGLLLLFTYTLLKSDDRRRSRKKLEKKALRSFFSISTSRKHAKK